MSKQDTSEDLPEVFLYDFGARQFDVYDWHFTCRACQQVGNQTWSESHACDRPSEATDKLKTWDEKFAEEFLTQDRTNEAITDARIDAYEQYAKGSVGACRQDIAELVAEVRRLRAEPRTDYAPGEREALLALVHAARWVLTRHYNEHHESMRELKKMISNFDATQKRGDGT